VQPAHPFEQGIGMEFYCTDGPSIGGRLRDRFEDFVVEEITPDGTVLEAKEWPSETAVGSTVSIQGVRSKYVQFVLQKMGLSTLDAATIVAAAVKVSRHLVTYAGLKDKRALTVQAMSLPAQAFESLCRIHLSRIAVREPQYVRRPIQIGDLWGNRFTIVLKDLKVDCDIASTLADSLRGRPILNYFGVQRFGVARPFTHLIGKSLVKKNYEEAVRLMLSTTRDFEWQGPAEEELQTFEGVPFSEDSSDRITKGARYEQAVAQHIIKHPADYERALARVPPRVLTILVHSYQSYLFNRLLSLRAKSGLSISEPAPGDFIIQLDQTHSGRDSWLFVNDRNLEERRGLVRSGSYGLAAPVPGYSTKLPPSKQSDLLRKILKDENLDLKEFRNMNARPLDSPGGLHLVSIVPTDMHTQCTDSAIVLRFNLRKGSYATVILRELMKTNPMDLA